MSETRQHEGPNWPAEAAYYGTCDVCEKRTQVVTWNHEDAPTCCQPCYDAMANSLGAEWSLPDGEAE